jgi:hypothetical protein
VKLTHVVGLVLLAVSAFGSAFADAAFEGRPTTKVESNDTKTVRTVLTKSAQAECAVTIIQHDGRYFWASREDRELVHTSSGTFHYFTAPDGAGYVKVFDTHSVPRAMRPPGPRFRFMEHVSLGLWTITYWGATETCAPCIAE